MIDHTEYDITNGANCGLRVLKGTAYFVGCTDNEMNTLLFGEERRDRLRPTLTYDGFSIFTFNDWELKRSVRRHRLRKLYEVLRNMPGATESVTVRCHGTQDQYNLYCIVVPASPKV